MKKNSNDVKIARYVRQPNSYRSEMQATIETHREHTWRIRIRFLSAE